MPVVDSDSFLSKLHEDVLKTGFPTEVVAASTLASIGWRTSLGLSYLDDQTSQSREYDLRAYRHVEGRFPGDPYSFGVYLLIECKKSSKPWVIFTHGNQDVLGNEGDFGRYIQHSMPRGASMWTKQKGEREPILSNGTLRAYHHYFNVERWGHNYYEAFKGREAADHSTQIYTAINSVVNASRYHVSVYEGFSDGWNPVFHPVIVVDGELIEAIVRSSTEVVLERRDHLVLRYHLSMPPRRNSTKNHEEQIFMIDFVRCDYLETFAKEVDRNHKEMLKSVNHDARSQPE